MSDLFIPETGRRTDRCVDCTDRMEAYGPSTYGDCVADVYDAWYRIPDDTDGAVDFLAGHAGGGPILELGIGTGRVALPLAARGLAVHGVDASQTMVKKLRDKPGGSDIPVVIGDFARLAGDAQYSLVYVVFSTFFNLLTQHDQSDCFASVARHLVRGGRFVIQACVPDVGRFDRGQRVAADSIAIDEVRLEIGRHDPVEQRLTRMHIVVTGSGVRLFPGEIRYAYPSELDLMARLAGLRLEARFGGWQGQPLDSSSSDHISVYRA